DRVWVPAFAGTTEGLAGTREQDLYAVLTQKRDEEIAARRSLYGPHKDDVCFTIEGNDARRFGSQGQQRSLALALKIAEIEILRRVSGKNPLLLLDDVMSELDTARRNYFVELIGQSTQTVLTTTNLGYFNEDFLKRATIVEL
ncbi:MAG: DNA replication and repair protein RecF, partial [Coriobacteriales bacterium]|nr:DNA replication and repair protein RecF [Coriobacteriales bacterium]